MSGTDTTRGIGFQNAYSLLRILELLDQPSRVARIYVEGQGADVEDLRVCGASGADEVVQVKKCEAGDGPGTWSSSNVVTVLKKFYKDPLPAATYRFHAYGQEGASVLTVRIACEAVVRGEEKRHKKAIAEVARALGVTQKKTIEFMKKLKIEVTGRSEEDYKLHIKDRLRRHAPALSQTAMDAMYSQLYEKVLEKAKKRDSNDRVIDRDTLTSWMRDCYPAGATAERRFELSLEELCKQRRLVEQLLRDADPSKELTLRGELSTLGAEIAKRESLLFYERLQTFDFNQQVSHFCDTTRDARPVMFLIYGERDAGQRWLMNLLIRTTRLPNAIVKKRPFSRISRNRDAVWRDLAPGTTGQVPSSEAVVSTVLDWLRTKDVILIFPAIEEGTPKSLRGLMDDFWLPLVERVKSCPRGSSKLLAFLLSDSPEVKDWLAPRPETEAPAALDLPRPLPLSKLGRTEFRQWWQSNGRQFTGCRDSEEVFCNTVFAGAVEAYPQPLIIEICNYFERDYYSEEAMWLTH